jgi:hypothetical protein
VVHGLGFIAYIVLVRLQSQQARRESRAALTEQFAGQQITLRSEVVARLAELEAHERVRRLEPGEREELNQLQELRAWSVEHNQALASGPAPPAPGPQDARP